MTTRERIVEEIEKVPDEHLEELYKIIKDFEVKKESESGKSVMTRLRQIRISASPDFSIKANLYDYDKDSV